MNKSEEVLIYVTECDKKQISSNNNHIAFLVYGFIREQEITFKLQFIPHGLINTILFFYGKVYYIYGSEPSEDEYDYAIQLLSPIKMLGINANMNRIILLTTDWSKKNIIYGSYIIQINNEFIKDKPDIDNQTIGKLINNAKQYTPSHIIFRCKKDSNKEGTHLQFDVTYKASIDKSRKFPYYKFKRNQVLSIFEKVFVEQQLDIIEIYAEKSCKNGCYGVSILLFIDNDEMKFEEIELMNKIGSITRNFCDEMDNKDFKVSLVKHLFGMKSNGIKCSLYGKKSLYDMIYLVKGLDDGKSAWYYVMVDIERLDEFLSALNEDIIHLEEHGQIIFSRYGDSPPETLQKRLQNEYQGI